MFSGIFFLCPSSPGSSYLPKPLPVGKTILIAPWVCKMPYDELASHPECIPTSPTFPRRCFGTYATLTRRKQFLQLNKMNVLLSCALKLHKQTLLSCLCESSENKSHLLCGASLTFSVFEPLTLESHSKHYPGGQLHAYGHWAVVRVNQQPCVQKAPGGPKPVLTFPRGASARMHVIAFWCFLFLFCLGVYAGATAWQGQGDSLIKEKPSLLAHISAAWPLGMNDPSPNRHWLCLCEFISQVQWAQSVLDLP